MKEEFVNFIDLLMKANPELVKQYYTDDVKTYYEAIKNATNTEEKAPIFTENGARILKFFQEDEKQEGKRLGYKSSDIAQRIDINSKSVVGAIRKLVTDGYIEKIEATKPIVYVLSNKGLNYNFD